MIPTYEVHDLSHNIPHVNPYNYQVASSSCQTFLKISTQDQKGYSFHPEFHHPHEVDNFGSRSGSHDHLEKKNKGIKLTLWKKGVQKMKNLDGSNMEVTNHTNIKLKLEDPKQQQIETDNNIPIRVCSDCNTTKTPLWRSGPKGPKSLCNACGIRQRKARRAMAAAAATAATVNETNFSSTEASMAMKIKVQQQKQKITKVNTNHVVPFKKRCKFLSTTTSVPPPSSPPPPPPPPSAPPGVGSSSSYSNNNAQQTKKLCFEDFFVNLSNNLAIHRVFPQDEKEAAILLMALSSGLVHG